MPQAFPHTFTKRFTNSGRSRILKHEPLRLLLFLIVSKYKFGEVGSQKVFDANGSNFLSEMMN